MIIKGTQIEETFAEAFDMVFVRMEVTAADRYWVDVATREFCGYGTSVIACDAEAGLEVAMDEADTLDSRPGASIMAFGFSRKALGLAISKRAGQTLMTCPSTAVYDLGGEAEKSIGLGNHLRFFGDGFQKSKLIGERRFWRIPVMDGEFLVEETFGSIQWRRRWKLYYSNCRANQRTYCCSGGQLKQFQKCPVQSLHFPAA